MSSGHPGLNRGLLVLSGATVAAVGTALVLRGLRPRWADGLGQTWATFRESTLPRLTATTFELGSLSLPVWVLVSVAAALVLLVVLVAFLATARRSTTTTVLRDSTAGGTTSVDQSVAEALLAEPISRESSVASASVRVYTVRREPALELTVRVRRGADLAQVIASADQVLRDWDRLAGTQLPVVLRLTGRAALPGRRSAQRVS